VAGEYTIELANLQAVPGTPRTVVLSVRLRRSDAQPLPRDITLDTAVTDNRLVEYNVGCTYEEFGDRGEEVSVAKGARAYQILQTLTMGPLHERVQWFAIKVTIFARKPLPKRPGAFELIPLQVVDLGQHPVPGAPPVGSVQYVSLAGRQVPVYPGARDVYAHDQASAHWGSCSYVVSGLPYPSRDVEALYNEWALDHGWVADRKATRDWGEFLDATQAGEPLISQLWSEWRDRKSGERLVLVCRYVSSERKAGGRLTGFANQQMVSVGIYPAESTR
jgi:hypothetical protein